MTVCIGKLFLDSGQQRTAEPQDPGDGSHVEEEKA